MVGPVLEPECQGPDGRVSGPSCEGEPHVEQFGRGIGLSPKLKVLGSLCSLMTL